MNSDLIAFSAWMWNRGLRWEVSYSADRWVARIAGAEVRDGGLLGSLYGEGPTPEAAMEAYLPQVGGRTLRCTKRREVEYTDIVAPVVL